MASVLIVEDEKEIAELLRSYLERDGFQVAVAANGFEAIDRFEAASPDLIVLDLMLPGLNGLEVARRIRKVAPAPIIMLTARDREEDKIRGLELGADDYVTKPFSPREVAARVHAVLRRNRRGGREEMVVGDLHINYRGREVTDKGDLVHMTPTEWRLLEVLSSHPGQIFTRHQLIERTYGHSFEGFERSVDAHIKNLRQKLEPNNKEPRYILTVYGVGYKFTREQHVD